jgi:hypothetical protein
MNVPSTYPPKGASRASLVYAGKNKVRYFFNTPRIYICTDQHSGQWLIKATENHWLESGARLKATDACNLLKPVKVALRTRDKVTQTQDKLLKWIKNLNPELHTTHWVMVIRVLLVMKWQISWQVWDLNICSQDLSQLAASLLELPRKRSGTGGTEITPKKKKKKKHWETVTGLKKAKGFILGPSAR